VIQLNILVPYEQRHDIDNLASNTFVIIHTAKNRSAGMRYYIVETTEEEYTVLRLKYGSENVWLR